MIRVVFLLWIQCALGTSTTQASNHGDTASATSASSSPVQVTSTTSTFWGTAGLSSTGGNSTCPSRTVNYITHTLPKQCLRTDRVPYNSTSHTNITSTAEISKTLSVPDNSTSSQRGTASDDTTAVETTSTAEATPTTNSTETSTSTAVASSSSEPQPEPAAEDETDSPLDNANFLSFEEWKRQNLAKTGQSPDDIGRAQAANPDRPRPVINNALDSLGEEAEIDLDFTGFGDAAKAPAADGQTGPSSSSASEHAPGGTLSRSKDAGKTCKERTNYASFDCSATILKSNKECKSASSVLVENKDSYMLNVCSASNKFFIVELCTDIQIDTIVLANYEFFSSSFRHFRVSVSDRYPVKMEKWRDLGTFEARNTREIQAFLVENPLIWAKYLRIEFLSQYGTEYYCPVSLLRVHGTTMIEDFRHQAGFAAGDDEDTTLETEVLATPPVAQEPVVVIEEAAKTTSTMMAVEAEVPTVTVTKGPPAEATPSEDNLPEETGTQSTANSTALVLDGMGAMSAIGVYEPHNLNSTCDSLTTSSSAVEASTSSSAEHRDVTQPIPGTNSTTIPSERQGAHTTTAESDASPSSKIDVVAVEDVTQPPKSSPAGESDSSTGSTSATTNSNSTTSTVSAATINETAIPHEGNETTSVANATSAVSSYTTHVEASQASATANSTRVVATASMGAQPAQPSTQESFFKSFHKRLLQLESNSTLSLQYIEEQSRILRDAFSKVEKRQLATTSRFLLQLNETVMTELHGFRQAYDQLWQSTVIELEGQRETYQREMLALSARLTMVADELVWQKRMGIVQSTLLLLCLALVLFGRSSNGYIEMPLMQQMMNRSTAALRAGWESPPNSPSPDSRSPVSLFRRKLWRSSTEPAGETGNLTDTSDVSRPTTRDGPEGPHVLVEPPSPASQRTQSDFEDEYADDSSPNVDKKDPGASQGPLSPKRRKRPKKPPNWPKENGPPNQRTKSPLSM